MSMSNKSIVERFAKGGTSGKSHNMFIDENVLYSYGHHFPLLARMSWGLLQNADKYSVTTAKHQSIASRYADILIPFSCLNGAGIEWRDIELVDKSKERHDLTGYKKLNQKEYEKSKTRRYDHISISQYEKLSHDEKFAKCDNGKDEYEVWDRVEERRPSAVVFKVKDSFYLSSMDGRNYFLSLLPGSVSSVQEAFDMLTPKQANGKEGTDYLRQGEWFFIPGVYSFKNVVIEEKRQYELKQRNGGTGHHTVTRCRVVLGIPYVKGTVRHSNRDHRMLKLGDGKSWYMAIESKHVQSWGASGKVD